MKEERNESDWSADETGGDAAHDASGNHDAGRDAARRGRGPQERGEGASSGPSGGHGAARRDVRRHAGRADDAEARERQRVGDVEWFEGAFAAEADDATEDARGGHSVWRVLIVVGSPNDWAAFGEGSDEMLRWSGMLAYARRRRVRVGSLLEQLSADEEAKRALQEAFPLARLWAATVRIGGARRR